MELNIESDINCNNESQFSEYESVLLFRIIISNLAKIDLKRPDVTDYFNSLLKLTELKLDGEGDLDEQIISKIKSQYGSTSMRSVKIGKVKYILELEKKDIGEIIDVYTCDSSRYTVIKHYLISMFLSHSMAISHLFEFRKLIEKFELSIPECALLATKIEKCGFKDTQASIDSSIDLNMKKMIKNMTEEEKKHFFQIISYLAKCDHIIIEEELKYLKNILTTLDIDTKEKFINDNIHSPSSLDEFADRNHLNLLRNFFHLAQIDGIMKSVEKLFLIHLIL